MIVHTCFMLIGKMLTIYCFAELQSLQSRDTEYTCMHTIMYLVIVTCGSVPLDPTN